MVKVPSLILLLLDTPPPKPFTHYIITLVLTKQAAFLFFGDHRGSCSVYDPVGYGKVLEVEGEVPAAGERKRLTVVKATDEWDALLSPPTPVPHPTPHTHVECSAPLPPPPASTSNENTKQSFNCPALHIDFRTTHNLLLLSPLTANTLAKLATGLADDTLSCVARAWDLNRKGCVACPAMNDLMWAHPLTAPQLATFAGFWGGGGAECVVVDPVVKVLACGSVGMGGLAEVKDIVESVKAVVGRQVQRDVQEEEEEEKKKKDEEEAKAKAEPEEETRGQRLRRLLVASAKEKFEEAKVTYDGAASAADPQLVAPISPSPSGLIALLLGQLPASLPEGSTFFDLGCGDGRWLVALMEKYKHVEGVKCTGLEIDPGRIALARELAVDGGFTLAGPLPPAGGQVEIRKQSVLDSHIHGLGEARVVVMYLFREAMVKMGEYFKGREGRGGEGRAEGVHRAVRRVQTPRVRGQV